jgi:hypothetical protein
MYYVGQGVALRVKITDASGAPADPDTFDLTIKDPGGVVSRKVKADLTQNAIGDWQFPLVLQIPGEYLWDCITTNPPTATGIIPIPVTESRVAPQ